MSGLTASLGRFLADFGASALPDEAVAIAKTGFLDFVATLLAGRAQESVQIVRRLCPAGDEATLLWGAHRASARDAALVNGMAGHVLDYDDVALLGHPSTVLVPAILAEAQRLNASGAQALRAYVLGYEVWAELAWREPDPYHVKGWHATSMFGTVAAAGALAALNGLDADKARNALAIASSLASGLVANFGTMTKAYHAGNAAARAIDALRLACAGFTSAPDALEHHAGFLSAISPHGRVDRDSPAEALGSRLRILEQRLSIKKYPVCYCAHRAIDGVIDLVRNHDLAAQEIERVDVTLSATQIAILRNAAPENALEAKFSLEFGVAAALIARAVGRAQLVDAFVMRPDVRALFGRVHKHEAQALCPVYVGLSLNERVRIEMKDGRRFDSGDIRFARGHAEFPLAPGEHAAKFLDCAAGVEGLDGRALLQQLTCLETLPSVRALAAAGATPGVHHV
ncbi:MAG: MmgE/PrpD family protein [Sulfuricaulis sp.]|nr:MmgE/PrpD family protein [Sulfuricaulis sp.]